MSQEQHYRTVQQEQEWLESEAALPPHKRQGYAERMQDEADFRRKEAKIDEWIKGQK